MSMNNVSEQLLQAMEIMMDAKVQELEYDKTIEATIYSIVDLDTGEYKVRYNGNIFSAFSPNLTTTYKIDDRVYVVVPQGKFYNKKLISGLVSKQSLSENQLTALQNSIFDISPEFNDLYGGSIYDPAKSYGVIAGKPVGEENSEIYIYKGPDEYDSRGFHGLFQQYSNNYDLIKIQGSFLTQFYNTHSQGNYGLEIEFYAKGDGVVSYKLDLNSFNGDPYCLSVYSPQYVIIRAQRNYLLGLKSIKLFEENFVYDRIFENGQATDKENTTVPNIFVKDISLKFVEQKDLSDTNYYLSISALQGISFAPNISQLDLQGRLIYKGKDIMSQDTCTCQWYVRDLNILIGNELYDKAAGYGWRRLPQTTSLLTLVPNDVLHEAQYKLVVVYNGTTTLYAQIEVFNNATDYNYTIQQETNGDEITLQLVNNANDQQLVGDWYLSYPDGSYMELQDSKQKNKVSVSEYLRYSTVTFYCSVYSYDKTQIAGTIDYTIMASESSEDVTISYIGEDTLHYDANGDVAIEDSEKERTLQVVLTWKEGYGTAYSMQWIMRDAEGREIVLGNERYSPPLSMIDSLWVDSSNILHYNIKQKYNINFNNNTLLIKIRTIAEQEYYFSKEILFLKDGDQGTNGTTYVIAIRPCNIDGIKLSGFHPVQRLSSDTWQPLHIRCYVYKDGELINTSSQYSITYKWSVMNLTSATTEDSSLIYLQQFKVPENEDPINKQFQVSVDVSIDDKMNDRKVDISSIYPVDVAFGDLDPSLVDITSIPSYIKYSASGLSPKLASGNIQFLYNEEDRTSLIQTINPKLIAIEERSGLYYIKPASSFISGDMGREPVMGALQCPCSSTSYFIHPIILYLDTFGNEAINGWNGQAGIIDGEDYILAPQMGAGSKDSNNRFTGVLFAKSTAQDKFGIYGYQAGLNTFGLLEDGTAFFGAKTGGGQIVLDGTQAHIYGGGETDSSGRQILGGDASNGMSIYLANLNPSNPSGTAAIKVAKGVFEVRYDGSMTATSANITGTIYAREGRIGCDERQRGGWTINSNGIFSGTASNTVALNSDENSYFRIWAGKATAGDSYNPSAASLGERITNPARFVVCKDGFVYMRDAFVKGRFEADEGTVGGWNILDSKLVSSNGAVGMASRGEIVFWSGADEKSNPQDDPTFSKGTYFYVDNKGAMHCKNAVIEGEMSVGNGGSIGAWKVRQGKLIGGENVVGLSTTGTYAIWVNGNATGETAEGNDPTFGTGPNDHNFWVKQDGTMGCVGATVSGEITATSGSIGGWEIGKYTLRDKDDYIELDSSAKRLWFKVGANLWVSNAKGVQLIDVKTDYDVAGEKWLETQFILRQPTIYDARFGNSPTFMSGAGITLDGGMITFNLNSYQWQNVAIMAAKTSTGMIRYGSINSSGQLVFS